MAVKEQWRKDLNAALGQSRALLQSGDTLGAMQAANRAMASAQTGPARRAASAAYNAAMAPGTKALDELNREILESGTGGGGGDTGGGGGGDTTPTGPTAEELYYQNLQEQARQGARAFLRALLEQYNLGSLAGEVERLVGDTTNELVIAQRLRETEPYKQRFKGLIGLQKRGITDVRNEADYLQLETDYRQVFRDAGLRNYLGTPGSQSEYDSIARIIDDFSLSVNEVRDRVMDAQRVVADTPQEVRESLQRYYNISPSDLTEYVLDPARGSYDIQRKANAAIVGGYAQRAGLDFGAGISERIGEFFGGERDIMGTQIEPQLTQVSEIQKATERLAKLEKSELTAEQSALAAFNLDAEAKARVKGLQSRERARFSGTSGIESSSLKRTSNI